MSMKKVILADTKITKIMEVIMLESMTVIQELMTFNPLDVGK